MPSQLHALFLKVLSVPSPLSDCLQIECMYQQLSLAYDHSSRFDLLTHQDKLHLNKAIVEDKYSILQFDSCIIRECHVECAVDAWNEGVWRRWHNLDLIAIILHCSLEEMLAPILHTTNQKNIIQLSLIVYTLVFLCICSCNSKHLDAHDKSSGLNLMLHTAKLLVT